MNKSKNVNSDKRQTHLLYSRAGQVIYLLPAYYCIIIIIIIIMITTAGDKGAETFSEAFSLGQRAATSTPLPGDLKIF